MPEWEGHRLNLFNAYFSSSKTSSLVGLGATKIGDHYDVVIPCAGVPKNDGSADRSEAIRFNPGLQFGGGPYMRRYLHGDAINMARIVGTYGIKLTTVNECARNVMAQAATP